MQAFVDFFLKRGLFVNLLTGILIITGAYVALTMNREAFPNIDFDMVSISTLYPGASPQEVEKLVTNPLEETIKEVDGIKEYRSGSLENRSGISIVIDPDVKDTSKVIDDIRSAMDRAEDLPEDAEEPVLVEVGTTRQPVIVWSIQRVKDKNGNYKIDYKKLREVARTLETRFLDQPGVARVVRQGWRDAEIFVNINPDLLNLYDIGSDSIIQTLKARNVNFPGGEMKIKGQEVAVRTIGEFNGAADILKVPLRSNDIGQSIHLDRIAGVHEGFAEAEILETTLGHEAINLTVVKRQSADIIEVVNATKRAVMEFSPYSFEIRIKDASLVNLEIRKNFILDLDRAIGLDVPEGFSENFRYFFRNMGRATCKLKSHSNHFENNVLIKKLVYDPMCVPDKKIDDKLVVYRTSDQEYKSLIESFLKKTHPGFSASFESLESDPGVKIDDLNDISFFVKRRLGVLGSNGLFGLIFVVASLFFFMGWRTSLMVAIGIPTAMGIAFLVMNYLGVTLNLISMFGLILVIGILVDDAIIVSENFYRYYEEGYDLHEAASKGASEVIPPVVATITTSVAAFGPMMFMTGIFGKFIFTIPFVVIIALLASLFECFVILPSHLREVNMIGGGDRGEHKDGNSITNLLNKFQDFTDRMFKKLRDDIYIPVLHWGLHRRWKAILSLLLLFFVSLGIWKFFVGFKLFPSAIDTLHIKVSTKTGTTKEETLRYIEALENEIKKMPDDQLKNYSSRSGITQKPGGNDPFTRRGSNYGQIVVYLTSEQDREVSTVDIVTRLRNKTEWLLAPDSLKLKQKQDADIIKILKDNGNKKALQLYNLKQEIPLEYEDLKGKLENLEIALLSGGPPVGKPVAIQITGISYEQMQKIAEEYKVEMRKINGIVDIDDDYLDGKPEYSLEINEELASQAGVSVFQIAQAVNTAFEGTEATSIRRPEEEVKIRVRFAEEFRNRKDALKKLFVTNKQGQLIPVSQMVRITKTNGVVAINHLDGRRLLTVTANVDEKKGMNSQLATTLIKKATENIPQKYPTYSIKYGGENKDTDESMASLGRAFIVGLLIIFMILASLFKSIIQPAVVLMAVPFSLIGVIWGFFLHGQPLSFLSIMGMVGLAGVVVNDSIVLVDFANRIRDENPDKSSFDIVSEAARLRLRPVMLTTLTTVLGLLPTAYGIGGYDPFLVPMALSFSWGLMFSTVLILGLVPILYSLLLDFQRRHTWKKFTQIPVIKKIRKKKKVVI